ncbi:MAG: mechanosensitive ion channel domain-containing protein [Candidatus Latescibacterota bacterium]|nr:mechanosensitive ion channel domain-containing protein [Candidatus Latescibacterota bacterium]
MPELMKSVIDLLANDTRQLTESALKLAGALLLAWVSYFVARTILVRGLGRIIQRTRSELDDILLERHVLRRLSMLVPIVVLYYGASVLPGSEETVRQLLNGLLTVALVLLAGAVITAFQDIYSELDTYREVPIKSYAQILKILLYVLGGLATVAVLTGKSPWVLLSGVGALMAVIVLVFRDTILSLVASVNIASNRLVKIGDWIEAPAFDADGDVIDIALHTVKVQNWDKTITTIPTHKLVENSFKNWQGMTDSGGRRIKRAIHIDMNSIQFCDAEMLKRFDRFQILRDYISQRQSEVEAYNHAQQVDNSELINGRRLTNVGTFRAYVAAYLHEHPKIHQEMTFLVRQLRPTENGLPIEVYVFTNDTVWANFEAIQADIFDHLLAVVPEFELRVFQNPTGADFGQVVPRG